MGGEPTSARSPLDSGYVMFKLIDRLPLIPIALGALLMGTAPLSAEPHLVEKLGMLMSGDLTRPVDIFDLCMHGILPLLLLVKLVRLAKQKSPADES